MKYRNDGIGDHVLELVSKRYAIKKARVRVAYLIRSVGAWLGLGGSSALRFGFGLLGRHCGLDVGVLKSCFDDGNSGEKSRRLESTVKKGRKQKKVARAGALAGGGLVYM